ncbi:Uncharacterised protein [Vibrio cholerae]|nr:Uncharacterised protein [Vibrio cholerae]
MPISSQRHFFTLNTKGFCTDRVHAIGWRAEQNHILIGFAKRTDQKLNPFIRAARSQHLLRLYSSVISVSLDHRLRLAITVTIKARKIGFVFVIERRFVSIEPNITTTTNTTRRKVWG